MVPMPMKAFKQPAVRGVLRSLYVHVATVLGIVIGTDYM
jgi:hypothetical protein